MSAIKTAIQLGLISGLILGIHPGEKDLGISKVLAQSANPSAAEIADQLRPKTRSLGQKRNLVISKESDSTTDASPPAASQAGSATASPMPSAPASISLLVKFDFNSVSLLPETEATLLELARALQTEDLKRDRFLLEGHTDAKGPKEVNQKLSKLRAESVRDFLVKNGIDPSRLSTEGHGSSRLADTSNPFSAENRRVRVVNLE